MPITAARRFTLDGKRYEKDALLDHFSKDLIAEMRRIGNIAPEPPAPPPAPETEAKPAPRRRAAAD